MSKLHSLTSTLIHANYLKRKLSNSSVINEMLFELTALSQEHAQLLNLIFIKAVIMLAVVYIVLIQQKTICAFVEKDMH